MKQLLITVITFALMAGLAMANDPPGEGEEVDAGEGAWIIQTGTANDAQISQAGSGHSGYIHQVGDNNTGNINIDGSDNTGIIIQEGNDHNVQFSMGGSGNFTDIRQYGNSAHAVGFAQDEGAIFQNSDQNEFYSLQLGDGASHLITTADGGDVVQSGNDNYINVWQSGEGQTARLKQSGERHSMWITQSGSGNTTTINQSN